jgi:two-component system, chemotaxis family, protein-glutamate methylesterase/glutaminase
MAANPIKVVVVDDSALMRQILTEMLNGAPDITVVASAPDANVARELIKQHSPDVLTLDIEMPIMDGIAFLERIMTLRPMPVIMISSLTMQGAQSTMRALELGAVDYIAKPTTDLHKGMQVLAEELRAKVRIAAKAKVKPYVMQTRQIYDKKVEHAPTPTGAIDKIIAIGASTGGVEAITEVLNGMPPNTPPIIITQHMPEKFTASFAQRLNSITPLNVTEAKNGDRLEMGHAYIAPGGYHLELVKAAGIFSCKVQQEVAVSGHRPSVDVLFRSVAKSAGKQAVGVILTGMGRDGAEGLLAMHQAGAQTFGQDEASCVVYGMPKAAFDIGAVDTQCTLKDISKQLIKCLKLNSAS